MSNEYPSNAHNPPSSKPARQKQQAIITNARIRKRPWISRVAERGSGIWKDVLFEVVGPMLRDLFAEAFHRGVDDTFYHDNPNQSHYRPGHRPGGRPPQNLTQAGYLITDYSSQYSTGPSVSAPMDSRSNPFDFSQYVSDDYAALREVVDRLHHIVNAYNRATVNDLLELFDKVGDHVGENYGWDGLEALDGIQIRRVRGNAGYYLHIPAAQPLKKN